jgi:hypothetical protein
LILNPDKVYMHLHSVKVCRSRKLNHARGRACSSPFGNNGGTLVPAVEAGVAFLHRLQLLDVLRPAGKPPAFTVSSIVGGLRDRPRAGLALACSPCFIWSRSGISNSFDRKRAPADGHRCA